LFGTVLGIPRRAIDGRMADIIAFAELERHVDTPVKRYSEGMQARLSFAVAMKFPADIYIFDEVLAVVDGDFRARCFDEIRALRRSGRTVLYVSHDLRQITELCDRVMWLDRGRVQAIGDPITTTRAYAATHHELR
jgi:ABC-type polysaccharide/polyol phosphate transport system ATPase subunit